MVAAGAAHEAAGAQQVGAGVQHDEAQLLRHRQRAWAASVERTRLTEQTTAAIANLDIVGLLAKNGGWPRGATLSLEIRPPEKDPSAPVAGINRLRAYRHDAVTKSSPRKSSAIRLSVPELTFILMLPDRPNQLVAL